MPSGPFVGRPDRGALGDDSAASAQGGRVSGGAPARLPPPAPLRRPRGSCPPSPRRDHVEDRTGLAAVAPGRVEPHVVGGRGDVARHAAAARRPADPPRVDELARLDVDVRERRAVLVEHPDAARAGRDRPRVLVHRDGRDDGPLARVDDGHRVGRDDDGDRATRSRRGGRSLTTIGRREDGRAGDRPHAPRAARRAPGRRRHRGRSLGRANLVQPLAFSEALERDAPAIAEARRRSSSRRAGGRCRSSGSRRRPRGPSPAPRG